MYDLFARQRSPFALPELNCLRDAHAYDRLLELRPAIDPLAKADEVITNAGRNGRSCHFLIVGSDGSGRTSFANCLLGRYAKLRDIPQDRLLVPSEELWDKREVMPSSPFPAYQRWLEDLLNAMHSTNLKPPAELETAIVALTSDVATITPERISRELLKVASHLRTQLTRVGIALTIERVPTPEYVTASRRALQRVDAICVLTTSEYSDLGRLAISNREAIAGHVDQVILLGQLTGNHIYTLLDEIWKTSCDIAFPFPRTPIVAWQDAKRIPIGRVLKVMRAILDLRLSNVIAAGPLEPSSLLHTDVELRNALNTFSNAMDL